MWLYLVSLDSFCRDLCNDTNNTIIEILVCLRNFFSLFVFSLSSLLLVIREERRGKKKFWRHTETLMTTPIPLLKSWRENPTTTIKITNNKRCEQIHQKVSGVHLSLDHSCDSLRSLLITFFNVVEFISSKSFQQCRHRSFGTFLKSLFFYILN